MDNNAYEPFLDTITATFAYLVPTIVNWRAIRSRRFLMNTSKHFSSMRLAYPVNAHTHYM